jgi:predicted transcriptional regulator
MALRTKVLEYLEQSSSDLFTLQKDLDLGLDRLANELRNLLNAGYITKANDLFYLSDRGREYLRAERS